jgi:hypothetical protein
MNLSRRNMLKASGALALASGAGVRAAIRRDAVLAVYDSRLPESCAFAQHAAAAGVALVDVADADQTRWRTLRAAPKQGRIIGLTRWSDYVVARGALEDQRKRLRSEIAHGALFLWDMA